MERLRTLQIGTGWLPEQTGGIERIFHGCAVHLPQVGVEVRGLVIGSPQVEKNTQGQIVSFAPSSASLPQRWQGLCSTSRRFLAQEHYDLIASHFPLYALPFATGSLHVVHFHGPWSLESRVEGSNPPSVFIRYLFERLIYRRSLAFITVSQAFRQLLHRRYNVPLERIHVVAPGVELGQFSSWCSKREAREKLGWPQNRPLLLSVRRLIRRVGLECLIDAIGLLRPNYPEILLLIAGSGPLRSEMQRRVDELGLRNQVSLLGFVPEEDLAIAYKAADFSLLPTSTLEGFGLSAIESLACGTPALATPVGGLPEVLAPLDQSLLLHGTTKEDIAAGIAEVLCGQRILPQPGRCREYVEQYFTWQAAAERIRTTYETILRDHSG
jgi:glycosyltransferase involved in cell wall biosynthesis